MLDIAYIRENKEKVEQSIKQRGAKVSLEGLIKVDDKRRGLIQKSEELRAQLKVDGKPTAEQLNKLQDVKQKFESAKQELEKLELKYKALLNQVPNILAEGTPEGGEENNQLEKETDKPEFKFTPKDHLEIAEANGWVDFERGAKVAGNKFYFLKGSAVRLEMSVMQMVMDLVQKHGFEPMQTPHMVKSSVAEGTGFAPKGEEEQEYKVEGEDLRLIGTAEVPITGYHGDEILTSDELPKLYAGLSPSYRKEAGAYGKHSKGLYRVHQFNKLELYVLCKPEESEGWHQKILKLEEEICHLLEIPYRIVRIAAGDLGAPAYKKYDIEYYSPVDKSYRELTSCSNCTDYQSRNLNIRFRGAEGKPEFVHTLNGTACAFSRVFIALIENHQQADGTVKLPKALSQYYKGETL